MAGDFIGSAIETAGSLATSWMNAGWADQNRRWQEGLMNTAHQREVTDLRAAGLNPILSATGGQGAGTPQSAPAKAENPLAHFSTNTSAAQSSRVNESRLELERDLNQAQLRDIDAGIQLKNAQAGASTAQAGLTNNQSLLAAMEADPAKWQQGMRNLQQMENVLLSQEESNRSSANLSKYQSSVRSPSDLLGKLLESTVTGKPGSYNIGTILRRVLGIDSAVVPAGQTNGPRLPSKSRTSAKE